MICNVTSTVCSSIGRDGSSGTGRRNTGRNKPWAEPIKRHGAQGGLGKTKTSPSAHAPWCTKAYRTTAQIPGAIAQHGQLVSRLRGRGILFPADQAFDLGPSHVRSSPDRERVSALSVRWVSSGKALAIEGLRPQKDLDCDSAPGYCVAVALHLSNGFPEQ